MMFEEDWEEEEEDPCYDMDYEECWHEPDNEGCTIDDIIEGYCDDEE
ncbi:MULTISPECIES: hypothetical protein [Metallosphaera]|nr:hypothetical protein [Metallosphaera sedula]MCP6729971.1 hypothetical protein [Metallosphaera sedula]